MKKIFILLIGVLTLNLSSCDSITRDEIMNKKSFEGSLVYFKEDAVTRSVGDMQGIPLIYVKASYNSWRDLIYIVKLESDSIVYHIEIPQKYTQVIYSDHPKLKVTNISSFLSDIPETIYDKICLFNSISSGEITYHNALKSRVPLSDLYKIELFIPEGSIEYKLLK